MRKDPVDMPNEELEIEDSGLGGEDVFVIENGEAVPLKIPDDTDVEEGHDNVEYD